MKYSSHLKIGSIVRADNTGLGTLAWEFYNHFNLKVLIIENKLRTIYPQRFGRAKVYSEEDVTNQVLDNFLSDIDVLLVIQNPFVKRILPMAKEKGKKIVWITMYECMPAESEYYKYCDLFICPSELDFQETEASNKIFLPVPVNLQKLKFRLRKKAEKFSHFAGWTSALKRNGSFESVDSILHVKQPIQFLLEVQDAYQFKDLDSRITVVEREVENYWDLYNNTDVLVFPIKYGAISLPIVEALASGIPVISLNKFPFNRYLDKRLLIEPKRIYWDKQENSITFEKDGDEENRGFRKILSAEVSPIDIAKKIDEIAGQDISEYSQKAYDIAKAFGWDVLGPEYEKIFNSFFVGHKLNKSICPFCNREWTGIL
jgi:hypothetical protein